MIPKQAPTLQKAELSQLFAENKRLTAEVSELTREVGDSEFEDIATAAEMLLLLQERVEFLRQELRYTDDRLQKIGEEAEVERARKETTEKLARASPADIELQLAEARRVKAALAEDFHQLRTNSGRQIRDLKAKTSQQRAQLITQ